MNSSDMMSLARKEPTPARLNAAQRNRRVSAAVFSGDHVAAFSSAISAIVILWPRYFFLPIPGGVSANPFTLGAIITLLFATAILLTDTTVRSSWTKMVFFSPVLWVLLAFTASRFLSDMLGIQPQEALKATLRNVVVTVPYFLGFSVLFLNQKARSAFLATVVLSLAIAGALAVFEAASHKSVASLLRIPQIGAGDQRALQMLRDLGIREGALRARSIFAHPVILGQVMGAALPLMLHAVRHGTRMRRIIGTAGMILAGLGIVLSGTRSSLLVVTLSLAVYFLLTLPRGNVRAPIVIAGTLLAVIVGPMIAGDALQGLISGRTSAEAGSSLARINQLYAGLANFAQRPLIGFGEGMSLVTGGILSSSGLRVIDNGYLSLLLDFGLVGTCLWMVFLILVVARGFLHTEADGPLSNRSIAAALTALIVGIAAGAAVQSIIDLQTLLCIAAAMLVVVPIQKNKKKTATTPFQAKGPA